MTDKDTIKKQKEALLIELLTKNSSITMKEVNVVVREKFESGVAPAVFSKVKKALGASKVEVVEPVESVDPVETVEVKKSVKAVKKVKAVKVIEAKESEVVEKPVVVVEEKAEVVSEKKEDAEVKVELEKVEEKKVEVVEEPEIPVVKRPFKIEISIPEASTVFIAGSFNNWKKDEYRLEKGDNNNWVFDDELPEGEHNYKFVVDSREWFVDFSSEIVKDTTGVSNSLVVA